MEVYGDKPKDKFNENDISIAQTLALMRTMRLTTKNGDIVVPVAHATKPHFRVIFSGYQEKDSASPGNKENHDGCVDYLKKYLEKAKDTFRLQTFLLDNKTYIDRATNRVRLSVGEKRNLVEQIIFRPDLGSQYAWFNGASARARFSDGCFVESDLVGRPSLSFHPTGRNPGIIIEVIQTHPPEKLTFQRLYEMSLAAHFVIFYIIPDQHFESQYNRIWPMGNVCCLRFTFYMFGGKLFENGVHIPWKNKEITAKHQELLIALGDAMKTVKALK